MVGNVKSDPGGIKKIQVNPYDRVERRPERTPKNYTEWFKEILDRLDIDEVKNVLNI